jgi:hypothetical protein
LFPFLEKKVLPEMQKQPAAPFAELVKNSPIKKEQESNEKDIGSNFFANLKESPSFMHNQCPEVQE